MRHLLAAALIALGLPAAAQDAAIGQWRTQPDDNGNTGLVRIAPCDGGLCGVLIAAFNGQGQQIESPNVGRRILWDMAPTGANRYGGGKIWSPDRQKTYASKMELAGDRLSVSGCVLVVCRAQTWTRAN